MILAFQSYFDSPRCLVFQSATEQISFAEFWQTVARRSHYLKQQSQSRYALWIEDSYSFLSWFWAAAIAEKTLILPPHRIPQLEQDFLSQDIVFLDDQLQLENDSCTIDEQVRDWNHILQHSQLIFFTSGSTGQPKQILRNLQQLLSEVVVLRDHLELQTPYTMLASVSHQHIYGLLFKVLLPLLTGQAFIRDQLAYPEQIEAMLALVQAQGRHAYLITSPALLKRCTGSFDFTDSELIFSSGGKLESGIRAGYPQTILEVLGSSETGGIAIRQQDDAIWQVMPDVEIRIDEQQQLWVKTGHAYQHDWIATGDLAQNTDHGFVLLGRSDRIVKLEEKRLSLDAIEQTFAGLSAVERSYALTCRHQHRELLAIVVVLTAEMRIQLQTQGKKYVVSTLRQQLQDKLEPIAIPHLWRFVTAIPDNAQAKIDKTAMQALFKELRYPLILSQSLDNAQVEIQLEFLPELVCFKGHFSQFPVYPGVGQIGFLVRFAQDIWTDLSWCTGYEQLKFQDMIRPYDVLHLHLERQAHKISFSLVHQDGRRMASGRLLFDCVEG